MEESALAITGAVRLTVILRRIPLSLSELSLGWGTGVFLVEMIDKSLLGGCMWTRKQSAKERTNKTSFTALPEQLWQLTLAWQLRAPPPLPG